MERGFQLGNVGISLVLLLLLRALTGTFASQIPIEKDPDTTPDRTDDGLMEQRALESVTASGYGDVTVEDDENGANGENDEVPGDNDGNSHQRFAAFFSKTMFLLFERSLLMQSAAVNCLYCTIMQLSNSVLISLQTSCLAPTLALANSLFSAGVVF